MRNVEEVVKLDQSLIIDNSKLLYLDTGGLISKYLVDETDHQYGVDLLRFIPAIVMAMDSTLNDAHWFNTVETHIDQLEEAVYLNDSIDSSDMGVDDISPTDVIVEMCSSDFLDRVNNFSQQVGKWLKSNYSHCQCLLRCEVLEDIEFKNENILAIPCVIDDNKEFIIGCQTTNLHLPNPPSY